MRSLQSSIDPTKCKDIKDFDRLVRSSGGEAASVLADSDTLDLSIMCLELLHRLYSHGDFLPELDDPIYGACNEEICEWSNGDKGKLIIVHQGLGVARRGRESGDIKLLVKKLATFLFRGC